MDTVRYSYRWLIIKFYIIVIHCHLVTVISPDVDKKKVPFRECVNKVPLTVNGTSYMRWQIPLILAYSITTHKSQSTTAHNRIVYEPSKTNHLLEVFHM